MHSLSELSVWQSCRQRWAYSYTDCIEPIRKPAALSFGSLVHAALAFYYGKPLEKRTAKMLCDAFDSALDSDTLRLQSELDARGLDMEAEDERTVESVRAEGYRLLTAYDMWAAPRDANFTVLAVESETARESFLRITDLITQDAITGVKMAWEHKTASRLPDRVPPSFEAALTCYATDTIGIQYNYLVRGAKPSFVRPNPLIISEAEMQAAIRWLTDLCLELGQLPITRSWNGQCTYCSYYSLCACAISGGDVEWVKQRSFKKRERREG